MAKTKPSISSTAADAAAAAAAAAAADADAAASNADGVKAKNKDPENDSLARKDSHSPNTDLDDLSRDEDFVVAAEEAFVKESASSRRRRVDDDQHLPPPPDGGWGWAAVLGCFIVHFCCAGLQKSTGVLFLGFHEALPTASAADLTSVLAAPWVIGAFVSPLSAALLYKGFTVRQLVFLSGIAAAIGSLWSMFASTVMGLRLTWSLFLGIAFSLQLLPSVSLVGQYFERRRSLAMGVSLSGSCVAGLALPSLWSLTLRELSLTGTLIIAAGFALHFCVAGMLHKPLERRLRKTYGALDDTTTNSQCCADATDRVCCFSRAAFVLGVNFSLLLRPDFVFFGLAHLLGLPTLSIAWNSLPALAESRSGSSSDAALLHSLNLAFDLLGRLFCGVTTDWDPLRRRRSLVAGVVFFVGAGLDLSVSFASGVGGFVAYSVAYGLVKGANVTLRLLVLQDLVGRAALPGSMAVLSLFAAVGGVAVPPVAEDILDRFRSFSAPFFFIALLQIISASCMIFVAFYNKR